MGCSCSVLFLAQSQHIFLATLSYVSPFLSISPFPISLIPFSECLNLSIQNVSPLQIYPHCFPEVLHECRLWETSWGPGLQFDVTLLAFINVESNASKIGTSLLCMRAENAIRILLHNKNNHSLARDSVLDLIAIHIPVIAEKMKSNAYAYTFYSTEEELSILADLYSPGVYACGSQVISPVAPKTPQKLPFPYSSSQQHHKLEFMKSKDHVLGLPIDIRVFNATAYTAFNIWFRIDYIPDVQHSLGDVDQVHAAELKAFFCHPTVENSHGLISVTAVKPIVKLNDHFNLLNYQKKGEWYCTMRVLLELWTGDPGSTGWHIFTSPPTWPCSQCRIRYASARPAGKMKTCCHRARFLCSATTTYPSPT